MSSNLPFPAQPRAVLTASLPLVGLALTTALLTWPAWAHAVEVWSTTEEFSFGFLIPPIAGLLVWSRRASLRRSIGPGSAVGLPIVLGALAAYLLAARVGIHALAGLAVVVLLWGIVIYLWGWAAGRELAFPIGFLAFGLGLYRGLLSSVGFALQGITAVGAEVMARAAGVSVVREGLVLQSPQQEWGFIVAEACSGMSSLVSLLALAVLWIYVARGGLAARLAVLLSVAPLVIVANTARVTLVLLVASWFGQDAAIGFFHNVSSLVLFGMAVGGLLLTSWIVGCRAPSFAL